MQPFQSTPSVGRATAPSTRQVVPSSYFNPRPPWGGRRIPTILNIGLRTISIHALRGEGDPRRHFDRHAAVDGISIHALRGEGDDNNIVLHGVITISIHALRGEGDNQKHALTMMFDEFQSTPSVGRATKFGGHRQGKHGISIHALRGEGDEKAYTLTAGYGDFNPRPPWGGRPVDVEDGAGHSAISIHALRGEGDATLAPRKQQQNRNFNPRPPWGGRLLCGSAFDLLFVFQSTPSVGRATCTVFSI